MTKSEAIRRAGGTQQDLATLLGVTRQAVAQWAETMPPLRVYQLRELKPRWFRRQA